MKKIILYAIACACAISASAATPQRFSPRSVRLMKGAEVAKADNIVSAYLTVDPATLDHKALRSLGVTVGVDLGTVLTARLPLYALDQLSSVDGIRYVQVSTPVNKMLDMVKPEVRINDVHRGTTLSQPFTGKGVVVGIVDSGFDYAHAAFRDANGNCRIKRVWEQSSTPANGLISPERFGYGVEMTEQVQMLAAGGDIYNNSHGSHVTSIAAGSDAYHDGSLKGMAPDADIVLVSMVEAGGGNVNISDAIAYIFDYADEVDKPCVINLSLGSNVGPHDGTSTFDVIVDRLQGPGRLIVGASGNGRGINAHLRRDFASADDTQLKTFIEYKASLSDKTVGEDIEIWAQPGMELEVELFAYKLSSNEVVERALAYPLPEGVSAVSLGRNVSGSFGVNAEVSPLNGKPHVVLTSNVTSIRTGYAVGIVVKPLSAGVVDIWSTSAIMGFTSRSLEGYVGSTDEPTVCEIGGTAKRILTVGSYTMRNEYTIMGEKESSSLNESLGGISSFSGFGPTADGRVKPNVAAPGCIISAAVSSFDHTGTILLSNYHEAYDTKNYYGFMQGTSMASPCVAGIVATWLQAWPEMTPEDLDDVVRMTARQDEYTGDLSEPDNDWGYGKIDALAGIRECISRAEQGGIGSVSTDDSQPFVYLHDSGSSLSLVFMHDMGDVDVNVYSMTGTSVAHAHYQCVNASDVNDLPTSHLTDGVYVVTVSSADTKASFKIYR